MRISRLLFSPSGRLGRQAFVLAAIGVYAAGAVSQWLTATGIITRGGIWPFALIQVLLTWVWFSLHAKRLHDADRSVGLAASAAILYFLTVLLLLVLLGTFLDDATLQTSDTNSTSAMTIILFIWIVAILTASLSTNFYWLGMLVFVVAVSPIFFAMAVSLWAATRPSAEEQTT
jgi:uncharacterized membrane protein YhaH (DUF805 family)